jgi:alpha-1,3-glucosyltransferase
VLLPALSCRYYEATSEWTLDYPPLFAWFEWTLAQAARFVDPKMLAVSNLEYDSPATVLFQRLTVSVTGLVLVAAMLHATKRSRDSPAGLTAFFLAVCNAGLIMVDNIHFQYNGILLGALRRAVAAIRCCMQRQAAAEAAAHLVPAS